MELKDKILSPLNSSDENGYTLDFEPVNEALSHSNKVYDFLIGLEEDGEHISQYGVLGMKWGVRKDRRALRDTAKSNSSSRSLIKSMSDDELRQRIMRIEMEQKLNRLLTPPPKAGKVFINNVLKNSGQQLLTTAAVGAGTYALGKLAGRIGGPDLQKVVLKKK